ncbi:MAG TPA: hypothetical protein VGN72_19735 [Tepidisphaeraceae bacterium]|jgi:hypothetical protein|nr:hypothetical protein [Tepidisphaeraceae bacterium]
MSVRGIIRYDRYPKLDRDLVNRAVSEGNEAAVERWHDEFQPLHFEESATRRYGYQKRSGSGEPPRVVRRKGKLANVTVANPKYLWRKQREKGHTKPLVYSGRSEIAAKQMVITATARRGVGTFTALPKYFFQRRKDLRQPDKGAELITVIEYEVNDMARYAEAAATAVLNSAGASSTVRT